MQNARSPENVSGEQAFFRHVQWMLAAVQLQNWNVIYVVVAAVPGSGSTGLWPAITSTSSCPSTVLLR